MEDWQARLRREALLTRGHDHDHVVHVSLSPAYPPEYDVTGLVAVTFRLMRRPQGGSVFVTALDVAAALRVGARLGLDEAAALAFVDSHERMHIELQLAGVAEDVEEERSRFIDAVWLSLHHPHAADLVRTRAFGLVEEVGHDFWERLVDRA